MGWSIRRTLALFEAWRHVPTRSFLATLTVGMVIAVAGLALVISRVVGDQIRDDELARGQRTAELFARSSFFPKLLDRPGRLTAADLRELDGRLAAARAVQPLLAVTIWNRSSRIVYSSDRRQVGRRIAPPAGVRAALGGRTSTRLEEGTEPPHERIAEKRLSIAVPVSRSPRARPVAAFDLDLSYAPVAREIASRTRRINLILLGAALALYVLLLPSAVRAGRALREQHDLRRAAVVRGLRRAIARDEIELHYQPIADTDTRAIRGVEALVRWRRPSGELVSPAEFIPQAERSGAIWPLTLHIFELALRQSQAWLRAGLELPVAVNLSTLTLLDERLPGQLGRLLGEHGVPPRLFHLEITEGAIMDEPERAKSILSRLTHMGVGIIAIDDFGTGYSSLARLHSLPLDALKIDRSFVSRLATEDDPVLVSSIVDLGHDLGLTVIAEGVEDEATWDALVVLGCEWAQGYWLCRPLPARELERWLSEHRNQIVGKPLAASDAGREASARRAEERQRLWAAFTQRSRGGRA